MLCRLYVEPRTIWIYSHNLYRLLLNYLKHSHISVCVEHQSVVVLYALQYIPYMQTTTTTTVNLSRVSIFISSDLGSLTMSGCVIYEYLCESMCVFGHICATTI